MPFAAQGKEEDCGLSHFVIHRNSDHYIDCYGAFLQGDSDSLPAQYRNGCSVFWKKFVAYVFVENWAVIYLMVIFLGGVMELLRSNATGMTFFWIQAVIAALVLSVVTWYLGRRKQFGNQLFPVTLVHRGHAMEIMGYWDSGNQLREIHIIIDQYVF